MISVFDLRAILVSMQREQHAAYDGGRAALRSDVVDGVVTRFVRVDGVANVSSWCSCSSASAGGAPLH